MEEEILENFEEEEEEELEGPKICDCGECKECIKEKGECTCGDCDICLKNSYIDDLEDEDFHE